MLGESLDDSTANHDKRTKHNGPSSTESLSKPRRKWDRKDRAELVGRVDKAEQTWFDGPLAFRILSSVTEIYKNPSALNQSSIDFQVIRTVVEVLRVLERVDELRIETRSHLNTHTAEEQPDVHKTQIGLLVPWRLVLLDEASDDGVRGATNVDHVGELALLDLSSSIVQGPVSRVVEETKLERWETKKFQLGIVDHIIHELSYSPPRACR